MDIDKFFQEWFDPSRETIIRWCWFAAGVLIGYLIGG